jgi:hypothetical protein
LARLRLVEQLAEVVTRKKNRQLAVQLAVLVTRKKNRNRQLADLLAALVTSNSSN